MRRLVRGVVSLCLLLWPCSQALAQVSWREEQQRVSSSIERLSAATPPGGNGAEASVSRRPDRIAEAGA